MGAVKGFSGNFSAGGGMDNLLVRDAKSFQFGADFLPHGHNNFAILCHLPYDFWNDWVWVGTVIPQIKKRLCPRIESDGGKRIKETNGREDGAAAPLAFLPAVAFILGGLAPVFPDKN